MCYSATYDAGNNSETAHTSISVALSYRHGFPRSIRIQPNCHRNWHHQALVTGVLTKLQCERVKCIADNVRLIIQTDFRRRSSIRTNTGTRPRSAPRQRANAIVRRLIRQSLQITEPASDYHLIRSVVETVHDVDLTAERSFECFCPSLIDSSFSNDLHLNRHS